MAVLGRAAAALRGPGPRRQSAAVVASRGLQGMLRRLLAYLPRLGLLQETAQLIATIQEMEMSHPVGPGAITEFDQMFKIGCRRSSAAWWLVREAGPRPARRGRATPN